MRLSVLRERRLMQGGYYSDFGPERNGEILGPKLFEEYAVHYINRIIDHLQAEKMGVIVHICGQMRNVYAQVEMIHSDVLSFDSCVAMSDAKKHLKKHVLMGNVSTWTLEFGKPEKVEQLAVKCWRDGSGIISPACGLGTKHRLRIFRQSDWESGKQQKKKLKSERKTVNYEMTMKNMKRENLLEKLRKEGRFVENPCNGKGICGKVK